MTATAHDYRVGLAHTPRPVDPTAKGTLATDVKVARGNGGMGMTEPVFHQGSWWFQHPNGAWSRWEPSTQQWVPYAAAVQYVAPVRYTRLRGIARWTVIAIAVDMALSLVTIAVAARQLSTLSVTEFTPIEDYMATTAGLQIAMNVAGMAAIAAGILFVVWFYRAYQNLVPLKTQGRFSSGWAIGAWLIPILNLFRPKQIANDIWRTSDPSLPAEPGTAWLQVKVAPLLHWWWAAWVVASLVGLIVFPISTVTELRGSGTLGTAAEPSVTPFLRSFSVTMIATSIATILAGAFAIPVVNRVTERQERRAAQLGLPIED